MDDLFSSAHLLWWEKLLIVSVMCLLMLFPIYLIPKKRLRWLGARPFLSPNWISAHRIWIAYLGYLVYFFFSFSLGMLFIAFGYALDALDGMVARAMGDLNPDKKGIGKWWDPLADKKAVLPCVIMMWYRGHLHGLDTSVLLAAEVVGTILRKPFIEGQRWQRGTAARNVGKVKFLALMLCLLACLPFDQHWIAGESVFPNWFLRLSCLAAVLSPLSRLKIHPRFDAAMDGINRVLDSGISFFQRGGFRKFVRG
jgi:phosphatidylglycerophosphate synthase